MDINSRDVSFMSFKTEGEARKFMELNPGSELFVDWCTRLYVVAY